MILWSSLWVLHNVVESHPSSPARVSQNWILLCSCKAKTGAAHLFVHLPWVVFLLPIFIVPPRRTICVIDAPGSFHSSSPGLPKWLLKADVPWGSPGPLACCCAKWQETVLIHALHPLPLVQSHAEVTNCWSKIFSVEPCEWLGGAKISSFSSDWGDTENHSCGIVRVHQDTLSAFVWRKFRNVHGEFESQNSLLIM